MLLPGQAHSRLISKDSASLREVPLQVTGNGACGLATACADMLKGPGSEPAMKKRHGRQHPPWPTESHCGRIGHSPTPGSKGVGYTSQAPAAPAARAASAAR